MELLEERRLLAGIGALGGNPSNGPQILGVLVNDEESYSLFSPKPDTDGPTPLADSLTIRIQDFPRREATLPGDYNNDGAVDAADFVVWRRNFGTDVTLPNDSSPGVVDQDDYDRWRMNFGRTDAAPAPEPALDEESATDPFNYQLFGDLTGEVRIREIVVLPDEIAAGQPATASVRLFFHKPLPDDRYTFFISDSITDTEGNPLDGESHADEFGVPQFPTGDGDPGGFFLARFTIDSRPEIGSRIGTDINIDINGNRVWDPMPNPDSDETNVDLVFSMAREDSEGMLIPGGFGTHDQLFAGKFTLPDDDNPKTLGNGNGELPRRLFDQLAAYGYSPELGGFRWLIDVTGDGVVREGTDILRMQPALPASAGFDITTAIPVAGDFNLDEDGDEIGLYNAGRWAFDNDGDRVITEADLFFTGGLLGYPVVGDFDGDSQDDLAVFNSNTWYFDLANDGLGGSDTAGGASQTPGPSGDRTLVWGLPGTQDRPVTADMDQDGIDDIGLWMPATTTAAATWRFLVSNDPYEGRREPGEINTLSHAFSLPPNGNDYFAQFGQDKWRPIVGNFDPPPPGAGAAASASIGDGARFVIAPQTTQVEFESMRSVEHTAPTNRVQFNAATADAAFEDLNLVLTNSNAALKLTSGSTSSANGEVVRSANDDGSDAPHSRQVLHAFARSRMGPIVNRPAF